VSGTISLGGSKGAPLPAADPFIKAQIDAAVATLPARVGTIPFGPSVFAVPGMQDVFLELVDIHRSARELGFGVKVRTSAAPSCATAARTPAR
jgi:hypothetical protein